MPIPAGKLFSKSCLEDIANFKKEERCTVVNTFWPELNLAEPDLIEHHYLAFFSYLGKTLQDLYPHASKFATQEWDGLLSMVTSMSVDRTLTKQALKEKVRREYLNTSDDSVVRSLELAVRLWLGINVCSRGLSVGPRNPRDYQVHWDDDQPLMELVTAQFPQDYNKTATAKVSFDESFTAVNIRHICRFNIRWTDNLIDHLRLEGPRGRRSLSIYRHKLCLLNHQKGLQPTIIPMPVLEEATRTLDLLFPFGDEKTRTFLQEENIQFWTTFSSGLPQPVQLNDFKYWNRNLVELLNLLDGPPETVMQTLLDTRDVSRFATLWVAIFGIFGLTIVFGVLSTVYAVKQYHVAVKSYELALVQACIQYPTALPGFCNQ
jgi:hypothetical protein